MGKSSRIASRFEDETEAPNCSWNLVEIVASGVLVTASSGRPAHLFSKMRRACLSGCGSRKTDFAARRSLRRGIQSSLTVRAVRARGGVLIRGSSSGNLMESMKAATEAAVGAQARGAAVGAATRVVVTPTEDAGAVCSTVSGSSRSTIPASSIGEAGAAT
jgi:hypothetical protein